MTYFGNARIFYECDISDELEYGPTDCTSARKYYEMAFNAATNDEQRAKCTYMLAKCDRNDYYTDRDDEYEPEYKYYNEEGGFHDWKGFVKLKKEYAHTKYYKE